VQERRQHKRLPIIKDMAEPIELSLLNADNHMIIIPGVLTNFSAGGMDLVLMGKIEGKPLVKLSLHLPGFDRFEVEARVVWTKSKELTEIVGLKFTKIDSDHARQITHMGEAYWECEHRIRDKAATICFHGCAYWDLCEKSHKLSDSDVKALSSVNGNGHKTKKLKKKKNAATIKANKTKKAVKTKRRK